MQTQNRSTMATCHPDAKFKKRPPASPFHFRCDAHTLQVFAPHNHHGTPTERCVGCDIVQADHAPEAGVAQGIFHGILVRHQGKHQEEVEERLEEEVERRVKREHSSNQTQVRMHG